MRGHHWWGATLALVAAVFVAAATAFVGIPAFVDSPMDDFIRIWLPHLIPAVVLAFALLGLAGGMVIQQDDGVGAERGWLAAAHVIGPLALLFGIPVLCAGWIPLRNGYLSFTPGWAVMTTMLTAIGVTAIAMLGGQQLRRHPRGRRRHLFWLMSMDTLCVLSFAALVSAYVFVELPA
jgi:hypothetical protein